jgi:hypothetical protein
VHVSFQHSIFYIGKTIEGTVYTTV